MPAGKHANYRSFSVRKVVEWTLPLLLSLCALGLLLASFARVCFGSRIFSFVRNKRPSRNPETALGTPPLRAGLRD
jgi:hypothetical protein